MQFRRSCWQRSECLQQHRAALSLEVATDEQDAHWLVRRAFALDRPPDEQVDTGWHHLDAIAIDAVIVGQRPGDPCRPWEECCRTAECNPVLPVLHPRERTGTSRRPAVVGTHGVVLAGRDVGADQVGRPARQFTTEQRRHVRIEEYNVVRNASQRRAHLRSATQAAANGAGHGQLLERARHRCIRDVDPCCIDCRIIADEPAQVVAVRAVAEMLFHDEQRTYGKICRSRTITVVSLRGGNHVRSVTDGWPGLCVTSLPMAKNACRPPSSSAMP